MLRLDLDGTDNTPDIRGDMADLVSSDKRRITVLLGQLLRGPRSLWPVDTGRSKRAFFVQQRAGGAITVLNRAKNRSGGRAYAPMVEAGYPNPRTRNAIRRTIVRSWDAIIEGVNNADP